MALVVLIHDLWWSQEVGNVSIFVLLDLPIAFELGMGGTIYQWIFSFSLWLVLTSVDRWGEVSLTVPYIWMSNCSTLPPCLFNIHMKPLSQCNPGITVD